MTQQLLIEYFPLEYSVKELYEATKGAGPVRVRAILQKANQKNQNGRVYTKEVLMREAEKYNQEFVAQRRALGELDHPENRTVVNLSNVSHNIVEMHWEGDTLLGTLEILGTPSGNILKELMKGGIKLGLSSRGVGSVNPIGEGAVEVAPDYNLICWDAVSNPSVQGAFLGENVNKSLSDNRVSRINSLIGTFFEHIK